MTNTDLAAAIAELLGFEDSAAVAASIRLHRVEPLDAHDEGTPAREALERAVWADVTDGAEWPWS